MFGPNNERTEFPFLNIGKTVGARGQILEEISGTLFKWAVERGLDVDNNLASVNANHLKP